MGVGTLRGMRAIVPVCLHALAFSVEWLDFSTMMSDSLRIDLSSHRITLRTPVHCTKRKENLAYLEDFSLYQHS